MSSKYDISAIRNKLKEKGRRDPTQWIPPTLQANDPKKIFRFFILPPFSQNDQLADGLADKSMELFYVLNGAHYIGGKYHQCPRLHDGEECPLCTYGFDRMSEITDKKVRGQIAKDFLSAAKYGLNIYFLDDQANPDDLRGKVYWYNAPKQVLDILQECINRDDSGDANDPRAFGIFYDENESYIFQLEITRQGEYNEYKSSKFLANAGKMPIAYKMGANKQRIPEPSAISAILAQRHNIFKKFDLRDPAKLQEFVNKISDGSMAANSKTESTNSGFTHNEAQQSSPAASIVTENRPAPVSAKTSTPKPTPKPAPATPPVQQPAPEPGPVESGVDDQELQALLNQLG